jgi:type I restriction enzyme S subunit
MQISRYEQYKPSGVDWIGEIPAHWEVKKLKYIIRDLESGVSVNSVDEPVLGEEVGILKTSCVYNYKFEANKNKKVIQSEIERVSCSVRGNSIIISRMNTPDLVGASGYVDKDYPNLFLPDRLWQTVLHKDSEVDAEWLSYVMICSRFREVLFFLATGTSSSMKNISKDDLLNIPIPYPLLDEQTAIVNYSKNQTLQIDKLVESKQKLIYLLKEERSAIINNAVTRGINPNTKFKFSKAEWLGHIPAHWEVRKLKYLLESFNHMRVPLNANDREGVEKRYDYYGASGVIDKVNDYLFDGEYILVGEDGANLLARSSKLAFKAVGKFWVNNHAHILKPRSGNIDYFTHLLEKIDYTVWVTGSAQPKLTLENLINITLCEPPLQEQEEIVEYIKTKTKTINDTIASIASEVKLMQEYRIALIGEAVTGKIKVF